MFLIWKIINYISKGKVNPNILRNTFATRIVKENDLSIAKELIGENSIQKIEKWVGGRVKA